MICEEHKLAEGCWDDNQREEPVSSRHGCEEQEAVLEEDLFLTEGFAIGGMNATNFFFGEWCFI
jgi:hypothetical protein